VADMVHAFQPASPDEQRVVTSLITTLAKSGAERRPRISQPVSPTPLNRSLTTDSKSATTPTVPAQPRVPLQRIGMGALALAAIAGVWTALQDTPSTTREDAAALIRVSGPDSTGLVAVVPPPPRPTPTVLPPSDSTRRAARMPPVPAKQTASAMRSTPRVTRDPASPDSAAASTAEVIPSNATSVSVPPPPAIPTEAWFSIKLLYPDLTLFVDNVRYRVERQKTVVVSVTPGRHRVEVRRNECADQFLDIRDFVAGDTVKYNNKGPCPDGGVP
jgi:hypothetical protein